MPATKISQSQPVAANGFWEESELKVSREVPSLLGGMCCARRRAKKISDVVTPSVGGVAIQRKLSSDDGDTSTAADDSSNSVSDSESVTSGIEDSVTEANACRRYSLMTMLCAWEACRDRPDEKSATASIENGAWLVPGRLTAAAVTTRGTVQAFAEPRRGVHCKKKAAVTEKLPGGTKSAAPTALPPPRILANSDEPEVRERIGRLLKLLKEETNETDLPCETPVEPKASCRQKLAKPASPGGKVNMERLLRIVKGEQHAAEDADLQDCGNTADQHATAKAPPGLSEGPAMSVRSNAPWRRQKAVTPPPVRDLVPAQTLKMFEPMI